MFFFVLHTQLAYNDSKYVRKYTVATRVQRHAQRSEYKKKNIVQKKNTYFTILGTLYIVSFVIDVPRLASLKCILLCTLW